MLNEIKNVEVNDKEVIITIDREKCGDVAIVNWLAMYSNKVKNPSKSFLEFLSKNIENIEDSRELLDSLILLENENYKIELSDDTISRLALNTTMCLNDLFYFYDILKKHNLLNEKIMEKLIAGLSSKLPYTVDFYYIKEREESLRKILEKYLNSDYRDLIIQAVKVRISDEIFSILSDIEMWLRNPYYYQEFSTFLMYVRVLKDFGLEDLIKDEIEIVRDEIAKKYMEKVKRVIKRRIEKEVYKEEIKTLIQILADAMDDASLLKYLL